MMQQRSGSLFDHAWRVHLAAGAAAMLIAAGCSTNGGTPAREIGLAEFSQPRDRAVVPSTESWSDNDDDNAGTSRLADATEAASPAGPTSALPRLEAAGTAPPRSLEPGSRIIVDSLVGEINGRPIYADAFFAPIEDQLIAIARRSTSREFVARANEVVTRHLEILVQNELILADAREQLTTEQQQGLFAFMRMMRERTIAEQGGTRTGTAQRLAEQEGVTIEEYLAARRDAELVRKLQLEKIEPRIIVSWRDIEREYERRRGEFMPPARMKVSRIRLDRDADPELIQDVERRLAAGEPFHQIAEDVNMPDGGAWQEFQLPEEGIEALPLAEAVRDHLINLQVGQTSEPFPVGRSTWWLHLAEIDQPPGQSLYSPDVQRQLYQTVRQRRMTVETNRYISSLFEGAVERKFNEIRERLLVIAFERYGP